MTVRIRKWNKNRKQGFEADINIRWPDGSTYRERKKAPVTSESAAKRWGQQREAHLLAAGKEAAESEKASKLAPSPAPPLILVPTLTEFAPRFQKGYGVANQHKQSGIDSTDSILRIHLLPQLGHRRLDEITNEDIAQLKATFAEGVPNGMGGWKVRPTTKIKSFNNRLSVLSKLLCVALEWKVIPATPCSVKLLKVPEQALSFHERDVYERLLTGAGKVDPRAQAVVLLGGDAGLRRGEIIGLFQTDVDFKRHQLTIQRSVYKGKIGPTKNGKTRTIPMTDALEACVKKLRHLRGERVLYRDNGSPITPKKIRMWIEQVERRAGLPITGAVHILRHTFCSHLAMKGAPVRVIQELAGHSDLTTTLRYMHLAKGATHAAIELLNKARRDGIEGQPDDESVGGAVR
jgi:site-specific recombinase XerD